MILFRQKYSRRWIDWNRELLRFTTRLTAYLALMDDHYPSTDEEQSIHLDFSYPDVPATLNRWLPLLKWLPAIPHYIVPFFLDIATVVTTIILGSRSFSRAATREPCSTSSKASSGGITGVIGCALILVTDQYPLFRLRP